MNISMSIFWITFWIVSGIMAWEIWRSNEEDWCIYLLWWNGVCLLL